MTVDRQDKLAVLRNKTLERNDEQDPGGRIYIDKVTGEIYFSVTRILSATSDEQSKKRLESWLARPGSAESRDMAARRGTAAHWSAEKMLRLSQRLARSAANKRNSYKLGEDGLYRAPKAVTKWSLEKAVQAAPKVAWSASGFARGLRGWCLDHITAVHAVEFSGYHPAGFAGSCDCLVDIAGTLTIVDFKTTGKSLHSSMDDSLFSYKAQTGAYSLILKHMTGIQAIGGAVVVARRSGEPVTTLLNQEELIEQEQCFLERAERHFDQLQAHRALISDS